MALIGIEAVPASIMSPVVDDSMHTSSGRRYGFGASAPSFTKASPMHLLEAERGLAILPKLVKFVGPSSTRGEKVSPCLSSFSAAPSARLRVFMSVFTSASMARRGC